MIYEAKKISADLIISPANDTVFAEGPHHAATLRLLSDLHTVLRCANLAGVELTNISDDMRWSTDLVFWEGELAKALGLPQP